MSKAIEKKKEDIEKRKADKEKDKIKAIEVAVAKRVPVV